VKLRTATPASISFFGKSLIILAVITMAFIAPFQSVQPVLADKYDDQINALQQDINKFNAQAAALKAQANSYQSAVGQLQAEAGVIQAQIELSQTRFDQLTAQIADTEKKITENRNALGITIANLYVDEKISPLEMLASSKNISDYLDKQEYRNSVRDELTSTIKEIKDLQTQLTQQKTDVERALGDQTNSRNALVAKQNEQQDLLNQTQGQEAAFQQLIGVNRQKQADLQAQQQIAIAAAISSSGGATLLQSGAAADYPWGPANCQMVGSYSSGGSNGSGGDGYGYGCRQCVSYTSWRVARETGYYPVNWGDATNVPSSARASGYRTGFSPAVGSLAVIHGNPGHVAWVDAVNGDGTLIVSQYNYNYGAGWGLFSQMRMSASVFDEYVYIR